jgi:hypothetical protein
MSEKDDLNLLLDAALHSYSDPGAGLDSGLEQRILHRIAEHAGVHAQSSRRRRLIPINRLWAVGLSLAAATVLLVIVSAPWRKTRPRVAPQVAPYVAVDTQPTVESSRPTDHSVTRTLAPSRRVQLRRERSTTHAAPQQAPKLAVFPTPTPLSAQEQALVRLVSSSSAQQQQDLMTAQQQAATPLRVAAISIPPIQPPQEGKE